jgi:hypothetical protein
MKELGDFLNSNLFQTFVTLLAGIIAYIVYVRQKQDSKKDAANSLLLEIQHAERSIARAKDHIRKGNLDVDLEILQVNSWSTQKHLFSRDFDKDEWDAITEFYNKANLLDEAIKYNSKGFGGDVEQIRANKQRILADFTKDAIDKMGSSKELTTESVLQEFSNKAELFDKLYMDKQGAYAYNPTKPINDAKTYLEDLGNLSTTSVGTKLKRLAGAK